MPTILMLDCSLSMTRPVHSGETKEEFDRRSLAISGISTFLDYLTAKCKLEFVSLVEFSAMWVQSVPFTRDYDQVKAALSKTTENFLFNKTCIETALAGISAPVIEEWGYNSTCQVLLITDGNTGVGEGSLKHSLQTAFSRHPSPDQPRFPLPYQFPCKLHVLCLASHGDRHAEASLPLYQKLIDINGQGGQVFLPEGQLGLKSAQGMFTKLAENYYHPFYGVLKCGNLKCNMQIFPAPEDYKKDRDFHRVEKSMSRTIEICGFLDTIDLGSPPFTSRHLVLPVTGNVEGDFGVGKHEISRDEEEETDDGKIAAFTVLLHGSLKVEGMVALTQLAEDWFGALYSFADNKKKSNLVLSVFEPGVDVITWLGCLNHLAPIDDFATPPYGEDDNKTPFPVKPLDRRSYAQNCVVWIRQAGLQADIQKILRNARKLPEKQQHFYKELNRLKRAALSFGFHELLDTVAQLLQRECSMLPGNAHPDASLQLAHAASALTSDAAREVTSTIAPMRTHFSGE